MVATPHCPECGSHDTREIVYGIPTPQLYEGAERGEVALGGCSMWTGDPRWRCVSCRHGWGRADHRGDRDVLLRSRDRIVGRDRETGFLRPRRCGSYSVGHTPHHIQVLTRPIAGDRPVVEVEVRRALGVQVILETDDGLQRYLNHEVGRLVEMLTRYGRHVLLDEARSLLRVPSERGAYCFSIARPEHWQHCSPRPRYRGARARAVAHRVPEGLQRCERCGEFNGVCDERISTCLCFGHPCHHCGLRLIREPTSDHWDPSDGKFWHTPHFGWAIPCHACRKADGS